MLCIRALSQSDLEDPLARHVQGIEARGQVAFVLVTEAIVVVEELVIIVAETIVKPAHLVVAARMILPESLNCFLVHQKHLAFTSLSAQAVGLILLPASCPYGLPRHVAQLTALPCACTMNRQGPL